MKREHFAHFHIARFCYYEGALAFNNLKIGEEVLLKAEPDNHHDKYAVEIYHNEHKLGYVPRRENKSISKILTSGNDCFESRIQWINNDSYPDGQIGVIVYVTNKI